MLATKASIAIDFWRWTPTHGMTIARFSSLTDGMSSKNAKALLSHTIDHRNRRVFYRLPFPLRRLGVETRKHRRRTAWNFPRPVNEVGRLLSLVGVGHRLTLVGTSARSSSVQWLQRLRFYFPPLSFKCLPQTCTCWMQLRGPCPYSITSAGNDDSLHY
jgi:hypothetical protein